MLVVYKHVIFFFKRCASDITFGDEADNQKFDDHRDKTLHHWVFCLSGNFLETSMNFRLAIEATHDCPFAEVKCLATFWSMAGPSCEKDQMYVIIKQDQWEVPQTFAHAWLFRGE